jgi:hypothetical protein
VTPSERRLAAAAAAAVAALARRWTDPTGAVIAGLVLWGTLLALACRLGRTVPTPIRCPRAALVGS